MAGLGWLSCSVGTAPSKVMPLPERDTGAEKYVRGQIKPREETQNVLRGIIKSTDCITEDLESLFGKSEEKQPSPQSEIMY